jgi:hypothetical protein
MIHVERNTRTVTGKNLVGCIQVSSIVCFVSVYLNPVHPMHSMFFQSNDKASFNSAKCPLNSSAILPSASATIVVISE